MAIGWGAPAEALELQAEAGGVAAASSWKSDGGIGTHLRVAMRFAERWAVDVAVTEAYFAVDQRANTGLTLGVSGFLGTDNWRPFGRVFAIHQHEEGLVSVADHPWGTLFGIGAGIRHRAGGGVSLGTEKALFGTPIGPLHAFAAATATWFPDTSLGPAVYGSLAAGVGINYAMVAK